MQLDNGEVNIKYVLLIIVSLLGFVAWFYNSTVIPIGNMQIQLSQIQVSLQSQVQSINDLKTQVTQNSNDILILKEQQARKK